MHSVENRADRGAATSVPIRRAAVRRREHGHEHEYEHDERVHPEEQTGSEPLREWIREGETHRQAASRRRETLADTAVKETKKNGEFTIPGVGKLVKAERKARVGRNPQTGEAIKIKAKTVVRLRAAKAFKDAALS